MVAVTLKEPKASNNIITLRETIQFGRFRGCTGAELMKSSDGTSYLVWIYNNTDIQIESSIVNTLAAHGLVDMQLKRRNQKAGGGIDTTRLQPSDWAGKAQIMVDAARSAARLEHCVKDSVPIRTDREAGGVIVVNAKVLEPDERERICRKFRQVLKRETDRMMRDIVM
ncbi:hypothetical protein [Vibrio phage vB_VpaS_AL-2]|nr:hypothetical protein [Vibrio phage vB_VpaS_AL-2]